MTFQYLISMKMRNKKVQFITLLILSFTIYMYTYRPVVKIKQYLAEN